MRWRSKKTAVQDGVAEVYPRLWRFCVSLTGSRDKGDDLAQTTVLRALERADQYTPGTHLDRWMFVIARRTWLNEVRSGTVRRGAGLVPVEELDIASNAPETETHIFARQVFDVVQGLPEAQRITALLVLVEGYSYAETAETLEIPIGTVMSRVASARRSVAARVAVPHEKVQGVTS